MKKSIILIILILYLSSIVVIGFFCMSIAVYQQQIYATEIKLMNTDIKSSEAIGKYIEFSFDPDGDEDSNVYFLTWRVLPEDTTNKNVNFIYDETDIIEIEKNGIIRIKKRGVAVVKIASETNPAVNEVFRIIIR